MRCVRLIALPLAALGAAATIATASTGPEICGAINCRPDEINAGILTGPWRAQCRKHEKVIIQQCHESGGKKFGVCDAICPDDAWPQEHNRDKPPADEGLAKALDILAGIPGNATPEQRREAERRALDILQKAGSARTGNGAAFVARFFGTRARLRDSQSTLEKVYTRLREWTPGGKMPFGKMDANRKRGAALEAASGLIGAMQEAEDATGMGKSSYHTVAKLIDDLTGLGADLRQFLKGTDKPLPKLAFVNRVAQGVRAAESARQLKAEDEKAARDFAEDWLRMLPASGAPGYSGPASALASDIVVWTRKMMETSTEGLRIVTDSMENGKMDTSRLKRMESRLDTLRRGPWSKKTFGRTVKQYVEDIPVVGKIADLLSD